uniref:Uncharacterized protein n=1 Tax=Ditylum brightwellii TaxID=49249 RepID=A0A7S1ZZH7_9STRA|mmetsp:Transcript_5334/g.8116  ORF Transcript_5334/g.8116 Transcript_5334/m.8116 type:complete len:114 (+) Transcript_5334:1212-1553(+)
MRVRGGKTSLTSQHKSQHAHAATTLQLPIQWFCNHKKYKNVGPRLTKFRSPQPRNFLKCLPSDKANQYFVGFGGHNPLVPHILLGTTIVLELCAMHISTPAFTHGRSPLFPTR